MTKTCLSVHITYSLEHFPWFALLSHQKFDDRFLFQPEALSMIKINIFARLKWFLLSTNSEQCRVHNNENNSWKNIYFSFSHKDYPYLLNDPHIYIYIYIYIAIASLWNTGFAVLFEGLGNDKKDANMSMIPILNILSYFLISGDLQTRDSQLQVSRCFRFLQSKNLLAIFARLSSSRKSSERKVQRSH